jgi:hypothetical protein
LNKHHLLEKQWRAMLTSGKHQRLVDMVEAIFKNAIHSRSPKMRPSGKAGLRAEKSYYRLLYLEGDFQEKCNTGEWSDPEAGSLSWDRMLTILGQLTDIPELRLEIMSQIESALQEMDPTLS